MLMARYKAINLKVAENWEEEYQRSNPADKLSTPQSGSVDQQSQQSATEIEEEEPAVEKAEIPRAKKVAKRESTLQRKAREKIEARKAAKEAAARRVRAKKLSE